MIQNLHYSYFTEQLENKIPGVMLAQLAPLRSPPNRATAKILFPKEKTGREKKQSSCPDPPCPSPVAEKDMAGKESKKGQCEESWALMTCTLRGSNWTSQLHPWVLSPQIQPPNSRRVLAACL